MKARPILEGVLMTALMTVALWAAGAGTASAQVGCEFDCVPVAQPPTCISEEGSCTSMVAVFTPDADTWTFIFDTNNAIKVGTTVTCPGFTLKIDLITITQFEYTLRRDSQFANTVCNPSAVDGTNCVFYRVHGDTVPKACYDKVEYKVFWNTPFLQGNKHDWMLLQARCEEFSGDTNICTTQRFSEDITTLVDRRPPVGTDPVVGGDADGFSDYIVAISNAHPHKGIPATIH